MVADVLAGLMHRLVLARTHVTRPADDEVYRYATTTMRRGVVVEQTPQVTFGEARAQGIL